MIMMQNLLRMSRFFQARKHAWCFQTDLFLIFFLHLPQVDVPFNPETHNTTSYNPKRQQKSWKHEMETYKPSLVIPQIISRISSQRDFSKHNIDELRVLSASRPSLPVDFENSRPRIENKVIII